MDSSRKTVSESVVTWGLSFFLPNSKSRTPCFKKPADIWTHNGPRSSSHDDDVKRRLSKCPSMSFLFIIHRQQDSHKRRSRKEEEKVPYVAFSLSIIPQRKCPQCDLRLLCVYQYMSLGCVLIRTKSTCGHTLGHMGTHIRSGPHTNTKQATFFFSFVFAHIAFSSLSLCGYREEKTVCWRTSWVNYP